MISTLLKLGLSGYDVKPRFGAFQGISPTKSTFFLGKILVTLDTHSPIRKKLTHPRSFWGGGVHGKACRLIAYKTYIVIKRTCISIFSKIEYVDQSNRAHKFIYTIF